MAVNRSEKLYPLLTAAVYWLLPLLAMPLAFARFTGRAVPLYGLVTLVTFPVLTVISGGILLLFPERTWNILRRRELRWLLAGAMLWVSVTGWHWLTGMIAVEDFARVLFYILYPLAGAVLAPELKKLLPGLASTVVILLIYSGLMSEKFTGLTGNWNWTQGAITALLPGMFLLVGKWRSNGKWQLPAAAAAALFFILFAIFFPDGVSRSALVGALLAGVVIFFRERLSFRKWNIFALILTAAVIAGFAAVWCCGGEWTDTRTHIWRGAWGVIGEYFFTGCGQFSEYIRMHLPEAYFFSSFPAPHIDHAHNDFLHIFAESGIAGVIFYSIAVWTVLRRREKGAAGIFSQWIFMVMLVCGWFDQHNITILGGALLTSSAGILLAPRAFPEKKCRGRMVMIPAGAVMVVWAILMMMMINWSTGNFIRRGDLQLLRGDMAGAVGLYNDSIREKPTVHALYQLAELSLVAQRPDRTLHYLEKLENICARRYYRHTQRLKAVAAMMTGDLAAAAGALTSELKNAPFSVINARWNCLLLHALGAGDQMQKTAMEQLQYLCRLRKITVKDAVSISPAVDDGPFPQD
ncbi:MAG: O-antigen ligase family protein [Lentisphaeria bacterium]|nr:O-antigen ligase family protein [Lentisphaeria bacterium]